MTVRELPITFQRVLSIWWLMVWRQTIGAFVIYFIWGFIFGALGAAFSWDSVSVNLAIQITAFPFAILWGLIVIRMALKKRYREFRVALLEAEEIRQFAKEIDVGPRAA